MPRPGRPPLDPNGQPSANVCVRLSSRQYDDLYERAQRARTTVPAIIRGILARDRRDDDVDDEE